VIPSLAAGEHRIAFSAFPSRFYHLDFETEFCHIVRFLSHLFQTANMKRVYVDYKIRAVQRLGRETKFIDDPSFNPRHRNDNGKLPIRQFRDLGRETNSVMIHPTILFMEMISRRNTWSIRAQISTP